MTILKETANQVYGVENKGGEYQAVVRMKSNEPVSSIVWMKGGYKTMRGASNYMAKFI